MVTHLLKLIRSRLGGSCWILVELLVVFVILWFMMYYFVAQGMLTRMPVGFKLDHVYNVTLAIRPSDSPSFIAYEEGSEEPVRNIERIVERIERHPDVEVVGLSYYSLPYTDSNIGSRVLKDSINQRVRAMIVSPGMLLNMEVFAYAFAVCVALNLLSSMIPAWRTVRVSITDALNDK